MFLLCIIGARTLICKFLSSLIKSKFLRREAEGVKEEKEEERQFKSSKSKGSATQECVLQLCSQVWDGDDDIMIIKVKW